MTMFMFLCFGLKKNKILCRYSSFQTSRHPRCGLLRLVLTSVLCVKAGYPQPWLVSMCTMVQTPAW